MEIPDPIIRSRGLGRRFGKAWAVEGLDLEIQRGELFGLVGPDGAGKTTTLRLFAGLLSISEGEAWIAGYDLSRQAEAAKRKVGYMAQEFSLYGELSVMENLRFFAAIFDVDPQEVELRAADLLAFAGLEGFEGRRAVHLSGGMKKKLALACTLIHEPEVLLLDEPTTGVDPVSRREFWEILGDLNLRGSTIVVSTPYMDEADRCMRVGLMYEGRMIICDTPEALRRRLPGDLLELRPEDWRAARRTLAGMQGVLEVQTYGEALHLVVDDAGVRMPEIQARLEEEGVGIRSLRQTPPRMEQAFISLIRQMDTQEAD